MNEQIKVVIIETGKAPRITTISKGLESMQKVVGGYVEAVDLSGKATLWCNEEGLVIPLPFNRALRENDRNRALDPHTGDRGSIISLLHGTLLITGVDAEGETTGLDDADAKHYSALFATPETLIIVDGTSTLVPVAVKDKQ